MAALVIGDRSTSDLVVRLRTHEGRDSWIYCHSKVLIEKSEYFSKLLSKDWPTCQIIDSRNCVEVYCQELEFNFHVTALRLLYTKGCEKWYGVRNALGILQVAIHLGCHQLASACKEYLEATPWEEVEEEEILKAIPSLAAQYKSILSRLQPASQTSIVKIFISMFRFATSSPDLSLRDLKSSAQEQSEYILTEDDDGDPPLVSLNDQFIRSTVKDCIMNLLGRFDCLVQSILTASVCTSFMSDVLEFWSYLCDISWVCQVLGKMEMMKDMVHYWLEASVNILTVVELAKSVYDDLTVEIKLVEVVSRILETIELGNAIVDSIGRAKLVKIWLSYMQRMRDFIEQDKMKRAHLVANFDGEIWKGLESSFVSIILTLPSSEQAIILSDWLRSRYTGYPDLSEAFELWSYRAKGSRRRLAAIGNQSGI